MTQLAVPNQGLSVRPCAVDRGHPVTTIHRAAHRIPGD